MGEPESLEEYRHIVADMAWNPYSSRIAISTYQMKVSDYDFPSRLDIIDGETLSVIRTINTDTVDFISPILWSADGSHLYTSSGGEFVVYNADTGAVVYDTFHERSSVQALTLNPTGSLLLTVNSGSFYSDNALFFYDTTTWNQVFSLHLPLEENGDLVWADWSPDGQKLAAIGEAGLIHIWDGNTFELITSYTLPEVSPFTPSASWSPDGTRLVVAGSDAHEAVRIIDALSGAVVQTFSAWRCSPYWNRVTNEIFCRQGGLLTVWDGHTFTQSRQYSMPVDEGTTISTIALSGDGRVAIGEYRNIDDYGYDPTLPLPIRSIAQPIPYSRLGFDIEPSDTLTGSVIAPHIQVSLRDDTDAIVRRAGIPITLALDSNPSDGVLLGTRTRFTDAQGVATFNDVAIDRAGQDYNLVAGVERYTFTNRAYFSVSDPPTPTATVTPAPTPPPADLSPG